MNLKDKYKAKFLLGVVGSHNIPKDNKPQYVFSGVSNVGKSSLINMILGYKNLVKSSKTPGKTKQINFFDVEGDIYFVDLPGYGYAKISQKHREKLRKMILWYFISGEANIKKVILVIDAKVGLREFDRDLLNIVKEYKYDVIIAMNKSDKLNQKELNKAVKSVRDNVDNNVEIVTVSSKTRKNRELLIKNIYG